MKYSCAILISHFESLPFLHACIRQIRKYKHPEIEQRIIIAEQSRFKTWEQIFFRYANDSDIDIVKMNSLYSGYGIDYCIRHAKINTDYICQVHTDIVPISKNWLYLPIKLIEEQSFAFVGQLHFISKPTDTIYPPNKPFFSMSPTFNVARKKTYEEMSTQAGFTRFHNRPQSGLTFENNDWAEWAKADYHERGTDDDVVAFCWEDTHREHNKLGLSISGFIESSYGRLIDDLVFHFGSCREASTILDKMPEKYRYYTQKINEDYSDELIEEMVNLAKQNKPPHMEILTRQVWNGHLKKSFPSSPELDKRIEELKK